MKWRQANDQIRSQNTGYKDTQKLNENFNSIKKKGMETIKKNQAEKKNTISEMKSTLEEINSKLDEAED